MRLSFFIRGWSPSNCIPYSSLSGITDVRSGLQKSIYSTCQLIKLQHSVKTASHYRQTFKNLCLHWDRKVGNENAGVREPVATANAPESRSAESLVDGQLASLHCKLLTDLFLLLRKTKQSLKSVYLEIMSMSRATGLMKRFKWKRCHPLVDLKTEHFAKFIFFKAHDFQWSKLTLDIGDNHTGIMSDEHVFKFPMKNTMYVNL